MNESGYFAASSPETQACVNDATELAFYQSSNIQQVKEKDLSTKHNHVFPLSKSNFPIGINCFQNDSLRNKNSKDVHAFNI